MSSRVNRYVAHLRDEAGPRIKSFRDRTGMSQARLAEAIGLRKAQSISDAETGSYAPSADTLIALANLACRTDVAFSQWCLLAAGVEPELLRLVRGLRQEVKITLHVDDSGLVTDAELGR